MQYKSAPEKSNKQKNIKNTDMCLLLTVWNRDYKTKQERWGTAALTLSRNHFNIQSIIIFIRYLNNLNFLKNWPFKVAILMLKNFPVKFCFELKYFLKSINSNYVFISLTGIKNVKKKQHIFTSRHSCLCNNQLVNKYDLWDWQLTVCREISLLDQNNTQQSVQVF